jgi:aspartate/methionine/tyrosine aminotransferase
MSYTFTSQDIRFDLLRERAYNLRWASVPEGVIPLTAADPDFPSAQPISDAIRRYAEDRYHSYAPAEGLDTFREAVVSYYARRKKHICRPENVLAVNSAAHGIDIVCQAFLKPGDEAIVFNPVDFLFKYNIESNGATPVSLPVSADPSEGLDYSMMESLVNQRTKMLCLCNPLNPTGKVFTREELMKLGKWAKDRNLIVLSDEIWSDIIFSPNIYTSIASLPEENLPETYIVTGFSKSYGLASLRVGAIIAPHEAGFSRIFSASNHASTVHGCSALSQVAATSAMNECDAWLDAFVDHLQQARDLCVSRIEALPGWQVHAPQGCYVIFPSIHATGHTSQEMQEILMTKAKVAIVPGLEKWFGSRAEGHIRISFATSLDILNESFDRIQTTLGQL